MGSAELAKWFPPLFKHMVYAIFEKLSGSERDRFLGAVVIARSKLVEWKFCSGDPKGPLIKFKLTSKGVEQNRHHTREGADKSRIFERSFVQYLSDELELQSVENREINTKGRAPKHFSAKKVSKAQKDHLSEEKKKLPAKASSIVRKVKRVGKGKGTRKAKALG